MLKMCLVSGGLLLCVVALALPTCYADEKAQYVESIRQNYKGKINANFNDQIVGFSQSVLFYEAYASYFGRADVNLPGFKKFFTSLSEERIGTRKNMTAWINERGGYTQFSSVNLATVCKSLKFTLKRFPHLCYFMMNQEHNHYLKNKYLRRKSAASRHLKKQRKGSRTVKSYTAKMMSNADESMTPKMPSTLSAVEDALALERLTNDNLLRLMKNIKICNDPVSMVKLDDYLERQLDVIYNISNVITRLRLYHDTDNDALGEYILDSELVY